MTLDNGSLVLYRLSQYITSYLDGRNRFELGLTPIDHLLKLALLLPQRLLLFRLMLQHCEVVGANGLEDTELAVA